MPRIRPLERHEVDGPVAAEFDAQVAAHGRMTHMKRTLAHSWPSLRALMEWYPLRDAVAEFLGERLTHLFVHAISSEIDCLVCSTFFRRLLIESGEDPDALALDEREQAIVDFGLRLAATRSRVEDELYDRLAAWLTPAQIVALTAFGAMMVATNVFNNALEVDLDEYLKPYTKRAPMPSTPPFPARTDE
jgi:alkylhydroperoxidase family enzyme